MRKYIRQHDERDCGAACLATVATYYGKKRSLSYYREITKTDKAGTSLYGLIEGASELGLSANALQGSIDDLIAELDKKAISFPLIAHIISEQQAAHFVVLIGYTNNRFRIWDPARGKVSMTTNDFSIIWTGVCMTLSPSKNFNKDEKAPEKPLRKFSHLLKGQNRKMIGIIAISVIVALIGITGSFVFEMMIDDFANKTYSYENDEVCEDDCLEDHEHICSDEYESNSQSAISNLLSNLSDRVPSYSVIFLLIILLYCFSAAIQLIRGNLIIAVSKKVDLGLSLSYFNHIVDLPVSSISVRQTGEYLTRFSDASTIRNAISSATLTLVLDTMMALGCGIVLFLQNRIMFLVSLGMVVVYAVVLLVFRRPVGESNRDMMEGNALVQSYLKESLDGIETVKASNAGDIAKKKVAEKFQRFLTAAVRNSRISMTQDIICTTVELIGTVIILWIGFSFVMAKSITIGSLITFYVLLGFFTEPVKNLISLQPTIQSAIIAAERLSDILDLSKEKAAVSEIKFPKSVNEWRIENVKFRYGNRELTLNDISMIVKKGSKVALVGESGSGKTTLAKLFLRFYRPESGRITVNGKDLEQFNVNDLRCQIAYVDQNTFLFSDTIRNNLRLSNPDATDSEIEKVCELTKANEFIERLPLKYDTLLEENGSNLSGGQRQRLAIARALLKHPQLLILDEATSNLDTVTESAIKDTLFSLDNDITCIVIAHRLATVKNCDRIYVIDQGKIQESGTHNELLALDGEYAKLWSRQ